MAGPGDQVSAYAYPSPLAVENSRLFMAYLAAHGHPLWQWRIRACSWPLADWGDEGASALPDEELRWARARLQEIPQDPAQVQAKIGLRQLGWVHMCASFASGLKVLDRGAVSWTRACRASPVGKIGSLVALPRLPGVSGWRGACWRASIPQQVQGIRSAGLCRWCR